jgi:TIR domain
MPKIFLSYRRSDAADAAGRIFDRLVGTFGAASVFKDVDSIRPGADYTEVIDEHLGSCDVLLVIIGPTWLNASKADGTPRLADAADLVRLEIERALSNRILVIPVLVGNAVVPASEELPESLRPLVYRNAHAVRPDPDFHHDMDRLVTALKSMPTKTTVKPPPKKETSKGPSSAIPMALRAPGSKARAKSQDMTPVIVAILAAVLVVLGICVCLGLLVFTSGF